MTDEKISRYKKQYGSKWKDSAKYGEENRVNKNGYIISNVNLNPDSSEDLLILNALDNLTDISKSTFIRKALISYIEKESILSKRAYDEKEIKRFARDDMKIFMKQKGFEDVIGDITKSQLNEIENRLRKEMNEKLDLAIKLIESKNK